MWIDLGLTGVFITLTLLHLEEVINHLIVSCNIVSVCERCSWSSSDTCDISHRKISLLICHWNHHGIFFLLGTCVVSVVGWFVADGAFFFSFPLFSLFPLKSVLTIQNFIVVLLFIEISTSILIFLF